MSAKANILIVDDEANTLASLARAFRLAGHEAVVCDNAERALELARSQPFDLILSDVVMPRRDGLALLEDLKTAGVAAPVVMMSGQAHIEMAVRATRLGALDFLEKPLSTEKLLVTVENALKLTRLETENRDLRARVGKHTLVFTGETMRRVMAQIERVAASETRVCIYGETGTGKELVARTLHEKSHRAAGPFVTLNCAAVPAELIESELFGHEKGSFTGAAQRHTGKFEQAHRGTLFLDEIGDMPVAMQAKLLRVLEEGEVERIGADKPTTVDVRVVVATHRNLEQLVESRRIPARSLSSRGRLSRRAAAAARARRRSARAGGALCPPGERAERMEARPVLRRRHRGSQAVRVAGQHSRAAQRGGAAAAAGRRRGRRRGRAPGAACIARARRKVRPDAARRRRDRPAGRARAGLRARSRCWPSWSGTAATLRRPPRRWAWSAAISTRSASSWVDLQSLPERDSN